MKDTWLIVANSCVAHVFKVQKKASLIEIETLVHPESRLHNHDLVSDRAGRTFDSTGPARHAMEPTVIPKEQEMMSFAKTIAHYLENARLNGRFERLYLAASPALLGLLRQSMHSSTTKLVGGEINKDMTHMKPDEIVNNLPFLL